MRLNQYIAMSSNLSRRAADDAIRAGRVTISGAEAKLGAIVQPSDDVALDGKPIQATTKLEYIMLHKPVKYVTSRARQGANPTVYELLPSSLMHLQSVGRLDKDSSGVLLFTNDGDFTQRLTHPSFSKTKAYEIQLDRSFALADREQLVAGVLLEDGMSRVEVINCDGKSLTVSLAEGRNRQLRRTFTALGYTVTRLHRTNFGPYALGDLPPGSIKSITPEESL